MVCLINGQVLSHRLIACLHPPQRRLLNHQWSNTRLGVSITDTELRVQSAVLQAIATTSSKDPSCLPSTSILGCSPRSPRLSKTRRQISRDAAHGSLPTRACLCYLTRLFLSTSHPAGLTTALIGSASIATGDQTSLECPLDDQTRTEDVHLHGL